MNALTNIQYLHDESGHPAFAVMPIATLEWLKQQAKLSSPLDSGVPFAVATFALENNCSALVAWREHLGLTQKDMASRLNITQSAYSQYEKSSHLRKATREKIALALGIHATQLDF
ncbi:helix-turn-helix transcriptional regulator [Histophilus somni]|uniref:Helix-turn-helix transcriptional regulator n=2 Tax=Histophilus somni TaxID=731 RepID=A0A9Q7E4I3_HISSO|nr:helix-turn-helix transcriptional regulator [Histophilus somni]ACA32593.1 transcriptional regulator, XRE family [Histophilus somni 2336]ARU65496.1 transcriptional regulator [Histophilus somni]ARU67363.1 transcriptional regulator [Histophilus somni]ARU69244.1 transcriptional regulator [Histophilus somni]ARU71121.1 transcriptional regulator [Histophilus somni]